MTKKTVVPNYTAEQTAELVGAYTAASDDSERAQVVSEFAEKFGKKPRSLIAKLSREGVYVRKAPVSKVTGEKPAKKAELAEHLATVARACGVTLVSTEKLNKTDQVALIEFFEGFEASVQAQADMESERN